MTLKTGGFDLKEPAAGLLLQKVRGVQHLCYIQEKCLSGKGAEGEFKRNGTTGKRLVSRKGAMARRGERRDV